MSNAHSVHVVFGSGPLGLAVVRALVQRGRRVRLINRSGQAPAPAGVEVMAADATVAEVTRGLCQGATAVFQCAQPPYHQWPELFPRLQAGILAGAAASGAKLIAGENLYMYGDAGRPLTEDLPHRASTRKGRTRAQMAETLLAAHHAGTVRVSIGRASDFFGPGVLDSVMGDRVFPAALQGRKASAFGNLDLPHTYTFIDDFGEALVRLSEREEALGQVWHVPNAETVTTRAFIDMVFAEAGHPSRMSGMGKTMLRLGGLFIPPAREMVEMMYEFEKPFVVDHGKYAKLFGNHATPLRAAIRQTLAWYRDHLHIKN